MASLKFSVTLKLKTKLKNWYCNILMQYLQN